MTTRRTAFFATPAQRGRVVATRFGLRRESETKPPTPKKEPQVFSYSQPGRGVNGESSN